jgi:small-conductance mechanosensitive channel
LGFGFQKVISNLISGVILLGDRSIKPGDVIEVDDTYGWINTLSARYASVITRDGTEHLIPNETLITEKVVNWSFSDTKVGLKCDFGISYTSDIHDAMRLALQAAAEHERVLELPKPICRLNQYEENSIDFQSIVWLKDPVNGVNRLKSDLYIRLWDLFKEGGVEFPFPQRDLHLKEAPILEVKLKKEE